jgi:hypothetical protein
MKRAAARMPREVQNPSCRKIRKRSAQIGLRLASSRSFLVRNWYGLFVSEIEFRSTEGPAAQPFACGTGGRWFEPAQLYQINQILKL